VRSAAAGQALTRAIAAADVNRFIASRPLRVIAAGKAAPGMMATFLGLASARVRGGLVVAAEAVASLPAGIDVCVGGHPTPTDASVTAGRLALKMAASLEVDERLVVLLSGGASALLAVPAEPVSLADKQETTARLLRDGADIVRLNCVRKHLSRIKGGWLAAACGPSLTLAISDVIGDDLSVIGSGPTVADGSTYGDALAVLDEFGPRDRYPAAVVQRLERGRSGALPETPKPGDPRLAWSLARVVASRADALEGARLSAEALGYRVAVRDDPVVGEAREAARTHLERAGILAQGLERPVCILSGGETTVRVRGGGRGGRNQEFTLAATPLLAGLGADAVCASLGTDGIDGPTDAAGGMTDTTTLERARCLGLADCESYLQNNDSYAFLHRVGDLVITGPTGTNVGDIQILLLADSHT
jgi:hydroxypyruvate reductase